MVRRLLSRPLIAVLSVWLALMPALAFADRPGTGQPFGVDWTPIVYWGIIGGVMLGGLALGLLIDWGNR
jgi:hypothetical protein